MHSTNTHNQQNYSLAQQSRKQEHSWAQQRPLSLLAEYTMPLYSSRSLTKHLQETSSVSYIMQCQARHDSKTSTHTSSFTIQADWNFTSCWTRSGTITSNVPSIHNKHIQQAYTPKASTLDRHTQRQCLHEPGPIASISTSEILHGDSKQIAWRNLLQLLETRDPRDIVEQANRNRDENDKISLLLIRDRCRTAFHGWFKDSALRTSIRLEYLLNDRRGKNRLEPLTASWFPHSGSRTHELRQNWAKMRERNPGLIDPDQPAPWDPVDTNLPKVEHVERWVDLSIYDGNRRKPPPAQSHERQPTPSQTAQPSSARARMVPEPAARRPLATDENGLPITSFMTMMGAIGKKRPE
ncbi:hypothetical protein BST61_g1954 [Cercospora zeina]